MAYGTINAEQLTTQSGFTLGAGNASSFKNRILNGSMVLDQRNAGASTNNAAGSTTYALDRWAYYGTSGSKFSIQQSTTVPAGFSNSILITSLAATTIGTSDEYWLTQKVEGFNTADLGWGTADAKTVTLSFWVRSSLTGTFGGSFINSAFNYYYAFSYTISSANTWTQVSITVAGPTAGTWIGSTNGVGLSVVFGLSAGSTYGGATPNVWTSASYKVLPTGAVNILATNGATFYITGVQLEVGTVATSFDYRSYGTELALCQRYFEAISVTNYFTTGQAYSSAAAFAQIYFTVQKRAVPTITLPPTGSAAGQISFVTSVADIPATIGTNTANGISTNKFFIQGSGYTAAFSVGIATSVYSNGASTIQISAEL